jgi:PAS domain S-box-containing protein
MAFNVVGERKRLVALLLVMATVAAIAASVSIFLLYRAACERERVNLVELARNQARLIESVAIFNVDFSHRNQSKGSRAAFRIQIGEAFRQGRGFGKSGDLILAMRGEDPGLITVAQRRRGTAPGALSPAPASEIVGLLKLAVEGQSGIKIERDHAGAEVLAAYEPVAFVEWGLVAKIDLAEIRAPFLRAGATSAGAALFLILLGGVFLRGISSPLVERLESALDRLRNAQRIARLGYWEWNSGEDVIRLSVDAYRIYGFSRAKSKPDHETFLEAVHPEDRDRMAEHLRNAMRNGIAYETEYRILLADGSVRYVYSQTQIIRNSYDQAVGVAGTIQDITKRKQAEMDSRRLVLAIEEFSEALAHYDADDRLVVCNKAHRDLNREIIEMTEPGTLWEEFVRAGLAKGIFADAIGREEDWLEDRLARHRHWQGPMEVRRRDGTWLLVREQRTPDGGTVMIATDITELRKAEDEARSSRALLQEAIDSMSECFVFFDSDERLVVCNDKFRQNLAPASVRIETGMKFEEWTRLLADSGTIADAVGREEEWTATRVDDFRDPSGAKDHLMSDGRWIRISERRTPSGGTAGLRMDISDLKRVEEELRGLSGSLAENVALRTRELTEEILERKRVEKKLRNSEERLRLIFENVVDGIVTSNQIGTIISANPAIERILGYSPDELIGKNVSVLMPPLSHGQHHHHYMGRYLDGGSPRIIGQGREVEALCKDGTTIPVYLAIGEMRLGSERLFTAIVRDITHEKEAERALQESEERFKQIAAASADWFWETGPDHRFTFLSHRDQSRERSQIDQTIGKARKDMAISEDLSEDADKWHQYHADLAARRPFRDFVYRVIGLDGEIHFVNSSGYPVFEEDGNFRGYRGASTDISAQKRAEEELLESGRRLRFLQVGVDQAGDGLYWTDESGRFISVNQMASKQLGYSLDEFRELSVNDISPGLTAADRADQWSKIKETGGYTFDTVNRRKDGSEFPVEIATNYFEYEGTGYNFASVRDISERKTAELALRAAKEQADKANRAKSEFLSNMSHELRTPLNAILGFGQLLEKEVDDRHRKFVDHIVHGGDHLLILIDEVLDLSKIEAGALTVTVEDVEVGGIIQECLTMIQPLAESHNVQIACHCDVGQSIQVRADSTRLTQILLNLMSNAIKYNCEDGKATISSMPVDDARVRIKIADTGPGIPEDKQSELFMPFSRLGAENSGVEGTGIGLALTKRLVELMEGKIGFESTDGEGTTFWIEFPLADDKWAAGSTSGVEALAIGNQQQDVAEEPHTLLYIEDNPANLYLMEEIVARVQSLHMISAPNAEVGLDLARQHRPDLILMDVNLPGMNGIDALTELQKAEETRHIPAIAVSADAMEKDVELGLATGFRRYLTKPFNVAEVMTTIEEILVGEASLAIGESPQQAVGGAHPRTLSAEAS